jgi:hypothetical protein
MKRELPLLPLAKRLSLMHPSEVAGQARKQGLMNGKKTLFLYRKRVADSR